MLWLNRKDGEKAVIMKDGVELVTVHVLQSRFGRVKLGFEADQDVRIVREELLGEDDFIKRR